MPRVYRTAGEVDSINSQTENVLYATMAGDVTFGAICSTSSTTWGR